MSYELTDGIATIRFDDGKANAVSHQFLDDLNAALDQAESEASAVILTGRDGMFSAGFDLKEIQKGPAEAQALVNRGAHLFFRLFGFPMPLIGACGGHAVAAGAFILLCCDTRVGVAGDFRIGLNETSIGMTLPVFGHELVASRLSKRHVTPAVIQSRLYEPDAAVDAGFLDEVADAAQLLPRCHDIAAELQKLPTATYAQMKRDVREDSLATIEASLK
jgi:enoyl-CoA hydratase